MSSILILPSGKTLDVDRIFQDQGKPAVMGMMGGQKTIFETGAPPKPSIYQRGDAFFTLDGSPVTPAVVQPWLDDPEFSEDIKQEFRRFLDRLAAGSAPKVKPTAVRRRRPGGEKKIAFRPEDAGLSSAHAERV